MAQLKQRKRAIADAVLAEGESAVTRMDADTLLELFAPLAGSGDPPQSAAAESAVSASTAARRRTKRRGGG